MVECEVDANELRHILVFIQSHFKQTQLEWGYYQFLRLPHAFQS